MIGEPSADAAASVAPTSASWSVDRLAAPTGDLAPNRPATTSAASPGATRREWAACGLNPVRRGVSSIRVAPSLTTACRSRRNNAPNSSLGSGPSSTIVPPGVHAWSMVDRGRPSTTSAGRPSPNWASTWSVPSTPLANLAQAYCDSLVIRAPPNTAIRPAGAANRAAAATSRASFQGAATSKSPSGVRLPNPSPRNIGEVRRSGWS